MFRIFYNIFIVILSWVFRLLTWFHPKAKQFIDGRKPVLGDVIQFRREFSGPVLWVHAASLGEFEQGRPLIEEWVREFSDFKIVLTFFSPSGYEIRKNYKHADLITYLPVDTSKNAGAFIKALRPDIAVFVKYDFWFNVLNESLLNGTRVIFISVLLRSDQVYFRRGKRLFLPLFKKIDHFFVQNQFSKELLEKQGINAVSIVGDTRLDRVVNVKESPYEHPVFSDLASDKPIILFGSIWPSDVEFLEFALKSLRERYHFIYAPHLLSPTNLEQLIHLDQDRSVLLSEVKEAGLPKGTRGLIVDEIGLLSRLYRYARYAFIGGALRGGLHNTLEAAVYGIPIFYPEHPGNRKFQETLAMEESGAAFGLNDARQLLEEIGRMDGDGEAYDRAGSAAAAYIMQNAGATKMIVEHLRTYV